MEIKKIIPLNGHIYIEPVEKKQILVSDGGRLETFGRVIALADDLLPYSIQDNDGIHSTGGFPLKVGDYVAFELWDIKDLSQGDKKYYMVKTDEIICKLEVNDIHQE